MSDDLSALSLFNGIARLFPLPNLVLFPQAVQPLHIFEPRYRQMAADALAGDRLIAPVLLLPGWEADYQGRPNVHPVACLGRIIANQRLQDGRYNLLLRGLCRIRIKGEEQSCKLYRIARTERIDESNILSPQEEQALRRKLGQQLPAWFATQEKLIDQFRGFVEGNLPLGTLCDILAFALPLEVEFKQGLLEQQDVELRVHGLLQRMENQAPAALHSGADHDFPPAFSSN